jgi:hypothetical protein
MGDLTLGLWSALRAETPGPPPPHPTPLKRAERGTWLPDVDLRGWPTLANRIGPGWTMEEAHAIGWEMAKSGKPGAIVETIGVHVRHAAHGARAVAFLRRLFDRDAWLTGAAQGTRFGYSSKDSQCWVECRDETCAEPPGHPIGVPRPLGSREFMAAIRATAPLTDDGLHWAVSTTDTEESEE